jgi:hypothetical protein
MTDRYIFTFPQFVASVLDPRSEGLQQLQIMTLGYRPLVVSSVQKRLPRLLDLTLEFQIPCILVVDL